MEILRIIILFQEWDKPYTLYQRIPNGNILYFRGIFLIHPGILPFIKYNRKIYWIYATAIGMLLIQYTLPTINSTLFSTTHNILVEALLLMGIAICFRKSTSG